MSAEPLPPLASPAVEAFLRELLASDEPEPWWRRAACAETDPEEFFQDQGGTTAYAKRVCAVCPVRTECLEEALELGDNFGVRGGFSSRERRKLKPKNNGRSEAA